ncbi:WGR and DUF4132 domain-containing protein [Leadbettera azotonutricia]|uniref:WGR and DUF4132 domain-containing protein n=1 Tax=Leadbettera azotonutricia TaxID=150829 RepID=UPI000694D0C1|nr:DUF4132 domain-containing protein [Leadbettera azotonutricia]
MEQSAPAAAAVSAPKPAAASKSAAPAASAPAAKPASVASAPSAVPAATPASGVIHRSFIFEDGKSGKFWTVKVKGSNLITIYGRVGSDGEKTEKDFNSDGACIQEAEKLIAEKTKKGYVEQAVSEPAATPAAGADPASAAQDAAWEAKVNPARKKLIAWVPEEIFAAVRFADGKTPAPNALRFVFAEHFLLASPIPLPECAEILAALDKKSVQQALKALYENWLSTGADAKKKAVLIPYCFYTPINELLALKKQIYDWIDASRGALAAFASECFAANGNDLAFLAVDEISQKAGNKQVKKAAQGALLRAAADLGITLDELLDKIVPTLDFDLNGKRIFDFGPRQFEATLQKDFSLALTDLSTGKPIKSLPAPNAKDDKEKADHAKAELSELKKFIKAVVKSQTMRLERVLIDGRPWKIEAWKKLFVENPIMRCFASGLIWGAYNDGKLIETFRYMDDGTFNTARDEEYTLPETAAISLAHPIEMGEETTTAWKQQLEDYEIIQSIKQLEVKVIPLKDDDIETEKNFGVKRYLGNTVPESALTGLAKKYDMERGPTGDSGSYYSYAFNDTWLGLTAAITFDGPYMGGGEPGELLYAYFYKLPGPDTEDPMDYGEIAKGAGLDPRTLPLRFVSSILSIFDNLLKAAESAEEDE